MRCGDCCGGPDELGLARAYVAGDLDADGDLFGMLHAMLRVARKGMRLGWSALPAGIKAGRRLGLFGRPLPPPPEEARLRGGVHSLRRDAAAIGHHYDVGNDFYRIVLGPSMTYSCARFSDEGMDLAAAQASKHELICRKLGLPEQPGARLLDVGCGWGSMAIHAALHHDVSVVGITISRSQADLARKRAAEAGVGERVDIRLQDYRELGGEQFDAISSIGMSEHVGSARLAEYYGILHDALRPEGRLLNHAISSVGGSKIGRRSFIGRYVFPDGELIDIGESVRAMERAGFEVRDVESLREHYAKTLRAWVANLEAEWDAAVALAGERQGPSLAPLHGGLGRQLRGRADQRPPGPRGRPDRRGLQRDAGDAAQLGRSARLSPWHRAEQRSSAFRIRVEAGRVTAQFDHDPVRIEVVERVAPAVVELHQRVDAGGRHARADLVLAGLVGGEGDVVDPHRQPVALGDRTAPTVTLTDAVHVEEGEARPVAEVVEDVPEVAALLRTPRARCGRAGSPSGPRRSGAWRRCPCRRRRRGGGRPAGRWAWSNCTVEPCPGCDRCTVTRPTTS